MLFSQVQDGAGRRRWEGRYIDPCHPFSGPMSMRTPMRMSGRRRARSGAPPCDPTCWWPPALILGAWNQCHASEQESTVTGRLFHHTPPHPPLNPSELRLCLGWDSAVALRSPAGSPTQFNSGDSQLSTSHPACISSPHCGNGLISVNKTFLYFGGSQGSETAPQAAPTLRSAS